MSNEEFFAIFDLWLSATNICGGEAQPTRQPTPTPTPSEPLAGSKSLMFQGVQALALGDASLAIKDGRLIISNIGNTGSDGVEFDVVESSKLSAWSSNTSTSSSGTTGIQKMVVFGPDVDGGIETSFPGRGPLIVIPDFSQMPGPIIGIPEPLQISPGSSNRVSSNFFNSIAPTGFENGQRFEMGDVGVYSGDLLWTAIIENGYLIVSMSIMRIDGLGEDWIEFQVASDRITPYSRMSWMELTSSGGLGTTITFALDSINLTSTQIDCHDNDDDDRGSRDDDDSGPGDCDSRDDDDR